MRGSSLIVGLQCILDLLRLLTSRSPPNLQPSNPILLLALLALPWPDRPALGDGRRRDSALLLFGSAFGLFLLLAELLEAFFGGPLLRELLVPRSLLHGIQEFNLVLIERAELVGQLGRFFKCFLLRGCRALKPTPVSGGVSL